MKSLPTPELGGPESTSQLEGTSTEVMGFPGWAERRAIMSSKGGRMGPEKEKPVVGELDTCEFRVGSLVGARRHTENRIDDMV